MLGLRIPRQVRYDPNDHAGHGVGLVVPGVQRLVQHIRRRGVPLLRDRVGLVHPGRLPAAPAHCDDQLPPARDGRRLLALDGGRRVGLVLYDLHLLHLHAAAGAARELGADRGVGRALPGVRPRRQPRTGLRKAVRAVGGGLLWEGLQSIVPRRSPVRLAARPQATSHLRLHVAHLSLRPGRVGMALGPWRAFEGGRGRRVGVGCRSVDRKEKDARTCAPTRPCLRVSPC
mmetsp:Transcript_41948/g.111732  ORF Transcript_41948/g.111732 Transcript_41948/m.111732 type:complete len:230 (+) Transcript_41948:1017-1706(+)